jgi:hypothetical protein
MGGRYENGMQQASAMLRKRGPKVAPVSLNPACHIHLHDLASLWYMSCQDKPSLRQGTAQPPGVLRYRYDLGDL